MTNLIGHSLGRYHILEQLGEGGMAVVYKAYDTRLERNVAIKVILPGKQQSEKFLKRFEREAKTLAKLSHPNIVKVIDYGEHEGLPYLVMEYLPGGTLKQKLAGKPIAWDEAVKILVPIARALAYAHDSKIIHRDIKPSNILITQSGEQMLSDFGIAKILEAEETLDLTGAGVGVGTPEYMSPEQAQGTAVDARSDVYSLGVVLYEMVTGRKPYQADTPMAVAWKLASEPLPRPKGFVKDLPDFVEEILLIALSKLPRDRYQSMGEFASILEKASRGVKMLTSTLRAPMNRKGLWIAVFSSAVVLVFILALFWLRNTGSPPMTVSHSDAGIADPDRTYLVSEDFEDKKIQMYGFSAQEGWEIVDDGTGNKVYQADNRNGNGYPSFAFGGDKWTDYVTEFRVKLLNEGAGFGLQVRSDTTTAYYVVDFGKDFIYLAYPMPDEWVRITTAYPPIKLNVWHTVKVSVQEDQIQVYVDGSKWIDERDSRFRNGEALFFASPATFVQVDDIKVWEADDIAGMESQANITPPVTVSLECRDANDCVTEMPGKRTYEAVVEANKKWVIPAYWSGKVI